LARGAGCSRCEKATKDLPVRTIVRRLLHLQWRLQTPMNDLRLKPFDFNQAVARAGLRPDGMPRSDAPVAGAAAGGFQAAMSDALKGVSQSHFEAQRLSRELQLDNPTVSIEQTMMAITKAQVGFQAALQVRNRFAQAYSDIMNMQV
jgi:flagellar hook-basal body complex protein FliE